MRLITITKTIFFMLKNSIYTNFLFLMFPFENKGYIKREETKHSAANTKET